MQYHGRAGSLEKLVMATADVAIAAMTTWLSLYSFGSGVNL
jgi:hypothetical protein